jgi:dTDP-4-dehydrorhamnose 3,5-epimerase
MSDREPAAAAKAPALRPLGLSGCHALDFAVHRDHRGYLAKPFHAPSFAAAGLCTDYAEDFFSVSARQVLRGFHVVAPPRHGAKLVYAIEGRFLDALLDLRRSSPTYGHCVSLVLDAALGQAVYLPAGVAHAFLALSERVLVGYKTESWHDPVCDLGVHWPCAAPTVSSRDEALPTLAAFQSPFE